MRNRKIKKGCKSILARRSQTATEVLIVLGLTIFILLIIVISQRETLGAVDSNIRNSRIRTSLTNMKDTAGIVYAQGEDAKTQILVSLPSGIIAGIITGNSLTYYLEGGEKLSVNLGFNVVGSLPLTQGDHLVNIESKGDYVIIYFAIFVIEPGKIISSLYEDESSNHSINITNIVEETINFQVSVENHNIPIELVNNIFSLNSNRSYLLNVTLFSNISFGRYFDHIIINGTSLSGKNQVSRVPVSLDVVQLPASFLNGSIAGSLGFLPDAWDFGRVIPARQYKKAFILYSGLNVSRNVTISFQSLYTWLSFGNFSVPMNTTFNISVDPGDYFQFDVYLRLDGSATEGNYSANLTASYNEGNASAPLYFQRPHDIGPPTVNNTQALPNPVSIWNSICVSSNVTDDVGVDYVILRYTDNNGVEHLVDMNDTNATCAGVEYDNVYGVEIFVENPGNYSIDEVYAADFEGQIGSEFPGIIVVAVHQIYGDFPFNGTIREEPNDGCTYGGDTWPGSTVAYIGDGSFVDSHDDSHRCSSTSGSCCGTQCCAYTSCPCWAPDWVEFDFPDFGVPNTSITNVELVITHRDDLTAQGQLNTKVEAHNIRHMIQCYDGSQWLDIAPYELSLDASTWINYSNIDISTCVKDNKVANDIKIRMTYDPFDDTGSMLYIDYVRVKVDTSNSFYPDLWDMVVDLPLPVDFTSGLNSTANTFGLSGTGEMTENILLNSGFDGPSLNSWTEYGTVETAGGASTIIFSEDFESSNWDDDWVVNDGIGFIVRDTDQHSGSYGLGFSEFGSGVGYIYKSMNLLGFGSVTLSYYYAMEDLEAGDKGWLDIYSNSWINGVTQFGPDDNNRHSTSPNDYILDTVDLSAYSLTSDFRIRFRSSSEHAENYDKILIDDITVVSSDLFGLTDYWLVDSNNNTNAAGLRQSFTPSVVPTSATLSITHSTAGLYFGEAWVYCNISDGVQTLTVWQEHWTTDIHNGVPMTEAIDVSTIVDSNTTTYTLDCGARVDNTNRTIVAFDDIKLEITYVPTSPGSRNDGWDWEDGVYGSDALVDDFVRHYDPDSRSDGATTERIEVKIGGLDTGTNEVIASGAWGVEFEITQEMYDVIADGSGTAYVSFNYYVEDLYGATEGVGMGGVWVKGRFGNENGMNYLGSNLDNIIEGSTLHYADSTPEVWAAVVIEDPGWGSEAFGQGIVHRSFAQDVSDYITQPGRYYLDMGGKISWEGGTKADDEGAGMYFDNVRILIKY